MSVDTKTGNSLPFEGENASNLYAKRMRSLRMILLFLCAIILFGTAIFYAQRSYFHRKVDLKETEKAKTPAEETKTPLPRKEEKGHETEEKKPEAATKSEYLLPNIEGSLYLKSFFKDMNCTMGGTTAYSVSCCGKFILPESSNEHAGCIILDAQKNDKDMDYTYRTRLTIENSLIGYSQSYGFPQPGNKCFDITSYPGHEVCLDFTLTALDKEHVDENHYNTCTLMVFGVKDLATRHNPPEPTDIIAKSETLSCDTERDIVLKKSSPKFATILRIFLKTKHADTTSADNGIPKVEEKGAAPSFEGFIPPYEGSIYFKSVFQNMKCDMAANGSNSDVITLSCCGTFLVPNKGSHNGCLVVRTKRDVVKKNVLYNVKFVVDNKAIAEEEFDGFPLPGKACFPADVVPGYQVCADLQYLSTDKSLSNEAVYETCKLMVFHLKKEVSKDGPLDLSAVNRTVEDVPCNTDKTSILSKTGTKSAVLRVTVEPITNYESQVSDHTIHLLPNKDPLDISTHLNDLSKEANSKEETKDVNSASDKKPMTFEEHVTQDRQTMMQKAKEFFNNFNTNISSFFTQTKKNSEA